VVGKLVARLTSPIKGERQKPQYSLNKSVLHKGQKAVQQAVF